ncbi:MAG: transposase [Clostridia bacterium]|nr:transposase [Clostridia bacterium]
MQFTVQQENSHLRNQNTTLRRRIAELESETGMDTYRQRCKDEAEKQVKELSRELNDRDGTISRQQKSIDKLTASLVRTKEEADRFKEKAEQEASAKTELSKKVNSLNLVLQGKDRKIERLEQENMEMKGQIASLTTQVLELNTKVSELEDANGKMNKELHTNSGNSGTPTSRQRLGAKPPVVNSRTPSDKAPGGQPNHPGHKRCQSVNACGGNVRIVGANDPLWNDPNYIFEGYSIKRSFTPVMVMLEDIYIIPSFRHIVTGAHKQVEHPSDLNNEVSFSPEYKAKVLAANQCLNLSVENVQKLIDIFTHQAGGKPSTGFISELPIEFATKSRDEQAKIYQQLCRVHTLHVDGTVVKVGKRQYNITILVSGGYTMYFFRPMKGKAGVKDTPIEETTAILVHDHDVVYYTYGCNHQECLEHILRYLTRSIEVETALSWAKEAMELLQKMIHAAKEADRKWAEEHPDEIPHSESDIFVEDQEVRKRFSDEIIAEYKRELLEVTQKGLDEYERHPAKTWFKEGYNTCKRMHDDPDYYLLFLSDDRVDATNADAEVKARGVKRKVAVALDFRGLLSIVAYCEGNTVINTYMAERKTTLGNMADIFRRDLTLEDTLCIKKTLVGIYASALESDRNIMKRNQKEMDKLTEQLTGFLEQKAIAQKEYENSQKQRIEPKID